MNASRRNLIQSIVLDINDVIDQIDDIESLIDGIITDTEEVMSDEESAFDNMPDGLQSSAKGDVMQEAIGKMSSASAVLSDCTGHLEAMRGILSSASSSLGQV